VKRTIAVFWAACAAFPALGQRPAPAPAASGHYYRMKRAQIVDTRGFEQPMTALTLLIPSDWQFQGEARYAAAPGCPANLVRLVFRATSADGRLGIEMFPGNTWQWADDPNAVGLLRAGNRQLAQFGGLGCDIAPPLGPDDFLRRVMVPSARRDARVLSIEPIPGMAEEIGQKAPEMEHAAASHGIRVQVRAAASRARLGYSLNGRPVEEWLTALTFAVAVPGPAFNMDTGQIGQALYYNAGADRVFGLRAPAGQLEAQDQFFRMVLSTIRVDPQWGARVTQAMANLQATDIKGARDRSAIITQNARDISNIINQTYDSSSRGRDRALEGWSKSMRGIETFRDSSTGETVELSNQYGHAWAGPNHEYIVSDSATFNPNVSLRGDWKRLEPVEH
jgi:hypothetical protein